ncbi:unnamed protein product [Closterium sp. NIES-53]
MFKGVYGKMVGLKNVLWVPNLAANLISVRRFQKAGMDTSSKGAKTFTARLGERILWDPVDRDVYNKMWQIPVVPMPKESKLGEHEESGAAAQKQHKGEENPKAAAEEEYRENMWGAIASAAFSNPTSATGECDWLTLHRRMGHVALSILQHLVKNDMVAGIHVKGEPDEVVGCPMCMQVMFTRFPFSSSEATAKAPLDEVVMDVVGRLKLGAAGAEYFLTILDVYTRMTLVYVLSKKSDVAETVKTDWLSMVERQQDRLVKDYKFMENLMYKYWKAENEAKIGVRFGEVKSSGLEHVELPLELSSGSTTKRQSSLVNGGEEAKDAEEEEEEVQQVSERAPTLSSRTTSAPRIRVTPQQRHKCLHIPAAEEEGRGKRRIHAPNRLTFDALGKQVRSALAGAAMMVGDNEESEYEEFAFAFFSPVEMPRESATLKEALESSDAEEWKNAMESELKSIEENGTWELVELPEGRKAITSKWLFKIKSDADGKIERYKSKLVAKGYQQKEKVDYKEMFAPVVKPKTLRTLLAGATIKGWVVKQMDVTTAFLNGILGTARGCYLKLRGVLEEIGFTPSSADHSLFMLGEGGQRSFMVVYVDDILIFSPSSDLVKEVMLKLRDKFKCKALGDVNCYLGLHIKCDVEKQCMRVHQRKYLEALAANFGQTKGHVATSFPSGFKCVKQPVEESVGEEERRRFHSLVGSLIRCAEIRLCTLSFDTAYNWVVTTLDVVLYENMSLEVWKSKHGPAPGRMPTIPPTDTSTATLPLLAEVGEPAAEDVKYFPSPFPSPAPRAPPLVADLRGHTLVSASGDEGRSGASLVAPAKSITGGRRDVQQVDVRVKSSPPGEEQAEEVQLTVVKSAMGVGTRQQLTGEQAAAKPTKEQSATRQSAEEPTIGEKSAGKPAEVHQDDEGSEAGDDGGDAEESTDSDVVEYDDAEEDVDFPELDPDMHADPEHRWDSSTMTVKEALASWKGKAVKVAMEEEIRSLVGMEMWELVERLPGVNIMKNRWVLTTKYHIDDTVECENARLVVKGFMQVYGADYDKTYVPVSSYLMLRIFLSIFAALDLNLMQLDMKNVFLQSKLDRQFSLLWYTALDDVLLGAGWKKSQVDTALYFKVGDDKVNCWVLVYVDDLLAASSSAAMLKELKELLKAAFEPREISPVQKYLMLEIVHDRSVRKLWLHQQGYADKLRRRFLAEEQNGRTPKMLVSVNAYATLTFDDEEAQERQEEYRQKVASLQFAATTTRSNNGKVG